jgi:hypothetical protein
LPSLNRTLSHEGGETGSVTITETEFSAGLARIKAETLSGSGRVIRVRLGPGQVTGLWHFPYPGVIGLAGLGWVTARVTGLARVKLG